MQTSHFDVVGLDHHMPGETGLDILPRIRNLPDAPPVVYVKTSFITDAENKGKLSLHGAYFDIASGTLSVLNHSRNEFFPL